MRHLVVVKKLDQLTSRSLKTLSAKLENLHFHTELAGLSPEEAARKLRQMAGGTIPIKAVNYLHAAGGQGAFWDIRLSLGGFLCILFSCRGAGPQVAEKVSRLADMIRVHFWKYKLRGSSEPLSGAEFNFSLAQVESDLKVETEMVEVFKEMESALLAADIIKQPGEEAKETRARPTDQLNSRVSSLQLDNVNLRAEVALMREQLDRMEKFQSSLVGTMQGIAYAVHGLRDRLNTTEGETVAAPNQVASGPGDVIQSPA